jgi:hypothetical protein
MQLIHWKDLGGPSRPGRVTLCDGVVEVRQYHIDLASKHGGRCSFKLDETGAVIGKVKAEYYLGILPYPDRS